MEVTKGALFYAGSKAVEAIWDATAKKDHEQPAQAYNQVSDVISPIITEWRGCLTAHFDKRIDFGTVSVEDIDVDITRYQILQATFSDFTTLQDAIHALAVTANANEDVPSAQALLAKWKEYSAKVAAVGDDIKTKGPLMVADSLKHHTDDLQKATDAVNGAT